MRTYLLLANQFYDALEYERALEQLAQARRFSTGESDDVLLSLYEGVILADLGRNEASTVAFKAALQRQPQAKLPVKVSPKVERRFEELRRQVERERAKQVARVGVARKESPEADASKTGIDAQGNSMEGAPAPMSVSTSPSTSVAPTEPLSAHAETSGSRLRGRAWIPATVSGALLVGGGVAYLQARSERSKLQTNDASLTNSQEVDRSVSRGRTFQTVGWVLTGAGVAGLGISAGMYLLGAPQASGQIELGMSTDGTSAFVVGRWP
ncbi:hypothetical protein [Corallococcus terminator]|uniref:hypothetical protein n=1 Tax=Corallococcus terminator TaxID=2316733 RepID=UPI0011C3CDC5|nr:hypothetical protein [Corallococcus terminator]